MIKARLKKEYEKKIQVVCKIKLEPLTLCLPQDTYMCHSNLARKKCTYYYKENK